MSEQSAGNAGGGGGGTPDQRSERIAHNPAVARVPERVARGAFATGVLVFTGQTEFVLDFLQGIARPAMVSARVVMAPLAMDQFLVALKENFGNYQRQFAAQAPPAIPAKPPGERAMTAEEIYSELKVPEELASGVYANKVMIGHSPSEFFMDFITSFYPNAAVASRVYISASRVPGMIETLTTALINFQRGMQQAQQAPQSQPPQTPPQSPPPQDPPPQNPLG